MLFAKPHMAPEETFIAYKNLCLLGAGGGIVGQGNAHFAVIASHRIIANGHPERSILIDGRIVEHNSMVIRYLQRFRRFVRATAKKLLPGFTLHAIAERLSKGK